MLCVTTRHGLTEYFAHLWRKAGGGLDRLAGHIYADNGRCQQPLRHGFPASVTFQCGAPNENWTFSKERLRRRSRSDDLKKIYLPRPGSLRAKMIEVASM